jgi:hypothetical protein
MQLTEEERAHVCHEREEVDPPVLEEGRHPVDDS